ncbi:unnamed protein product [Zymoseptoria tritici ST99CH_3D7]|uniref:Major facilitator superfamily (MFS) profile domain-containing protein n=1 Tax=Zymoseptoria tritici (strain ST99CH_3D7) TaxID=1276538 RepID=A0A1X7RGI0_ZYMT9|nr:unnamed protein product [Zymoseptoria tritici ST99CH_3D7]
MFTCHVRNRSLIPVATIRDVEKTEEEQYHIQQEMEVADAEEQAHLSQSLRHTPRQRRNLVMIYLLFLAEAIMSSSLHMQISVLLPSASTGCITSNTSFLRSILLCAYYLGSATGLVWGLTADRIGRRKVALLGLFGSLICCVSMGFATTFAAFCTLRYLAGVVGSAGTVAGLAMLADVVHGSDNRTKVVARLPVVAVCGQIGPLISGLIGGMVNGTGVLDEYPALAGQVTCGVLMLSIAIAETLLLDETLPVLATKKQVLSEDFNESEKATFLGRSHSNSSSESLSISIIEALADDASLPKPSHISVSQLLTAPSILILLASFSTLSLHSSTFDILLPHIGHSPTHNIGLGIPCDWLLPLMLVIKVAAAMRVMRAIPPLVAKVGLLPIYRRTTVVFPVIYVLVPAVALLATSCDSAVLAAVFNALATLIKTTIALAAQVLVLLLALSAAPDAASTGTLIGVISISELFKALAVGIAGISYYLSDDYSVVIINGALWAILASLAVMGALLTRKLRETPRVGEDLPEECFVWEGVFDVEGGDENGF